ncbi:MAG: hypothetical protein RIQ33_227 [Bacteroidota bacterium]|jgi:toxin YoeB
MKKIQFTIHAFEEYNQWLMEDKKVHQRLVDLIKEISRTPFTGKGKPEPLKHELKGYWSRRITDEHRLVYRVTNDFVEIIHCKYHYQ